MEEFEEPTNVAAKYLSINGLVGFFLAVILLLTIVFFLGYLAIKIQKQEATNYYKIEGDKVRMINKNSDFYSVKRGKE